MHIIQKFDAPYVFWGCGSAAGQSKRPTLIPPVHDELARVKLDITVRMVGARDVGHCSPQMTRSTRLTTAITQALTLDCYCCKLQVGLLFNSARIRVSCELVCAVRVCNTVQKWLVQSWMREFSQSYIVWFATSVLEFFTIIQLITYPLTSLILRFYVTQ